MWTRVHSTLHELYLPPFGGAVAGGVGSLMCSYNKIDGDYSCQHNSTLTTALRGDLGFEGDVAPVLLRIVPYLDSDI